MLTTFHINTLQDQADSAVSSESGVMELCEYEFMLGFVQMGDLKYGFIPVGGM